MAAINPEHYTTPLPENCSDYDMELQDPDVATNSSYVCVLACMASLIPPFLDGLGPMSARKTPAEMYDHIQACDRAMRVHIANIPEFLLRKEGGATATATCPASLPWIPLARHTLAISAAEMIIMIHRPVLFESLQSAAFRPTRAICVSAAVTILREHEQVIAAGVVSIWTHSAFCVTGAVVLGLELFHRTDHSDDTAHAYRQMLARASNRLHSRRCDAIARRGALLIDTLLTAEEDLVLRMMRTARRQTDAAAEDHQRAIINDMIGSHEIMARFLAGSLTKSSATAVASVNISPRVTIASLTNGPSTEITISGSNNALPSLDYDAAHDFDLWFKEVFAPVYDPIV
ncbi:hypothetical protein CMQ_6560 [Grosmannia clavigera kw1407]|uniref:C6 zinc finger domain containing protein n=1 Tax=Grosmannia clavigera (strain kw1407 / UAMH 11150) TaxID=655863 RepID=F0X7T8_GROCL|nr:uncharacterized protein CMQ_6560 [Grosmannia clavigera kw1407]EFX06239.1 hypothetical protein CMQ_6560 [Grosmannia clavigera kw1407]